MNLQTLRDRTNYGTFRTIGSCFCMIVIVTGILMAAAGVVYFKSMGWAAVPAVIYGIVMTASGVFVREASQLMADVPDLLLQLAHQQKAASRVAAPVPDPASVDVLSNSKSDFHRFVDDEVAAVPVVQSPQDMLASAREMLNAGQKDECKALLRELIRQHPQAPEADRARKALRGQG
jgi:hypothetical protein